MNHFLKNRTGGTTIDEINGGHIPLWEINFVLNVDLDGVPTLFRLQFL